MAETDTDPQHGLFPEFAPVDPDAWAAKVKSETGQSPEDFLMGASLEGGTIPAYLHRDALDEVLHVASDAARPPLSDAADAPANAWTLCQPLTHPDPDTANEHARTAVEHGAAALALQVAPTSNRDGLTLRTAGDLATVLDGVDLYETGLHLGGIAAPGLFGLLQEVLSQRPVPLSALRGSTGIDPVAALAAGTSPGTDRTFALADELVRASRDAPRVRAVAVDARVYHDAGASAVQELAATLGALTERLARSTDRDVSLSRLPDSLHVTVPVATHYFVEIAKLRALRLLVPQVVEAFADASGPAVKLGPADLHVFAEPSRRTETVYGPYVNMLRATTEAMAAVLGGCDALSLHPYDAALRPPDAFGLRIARNTQLILEQESHFDQVSDPAAGSYYIETLTDRLAQKAWTQFQEIEAEGGLLHTLQSGTLQEQIAATRRKRREAVDEREHILVGTTHYPSLNEQRRADLAPSDDRSSSTGSAASLPSPSLNAIQTALRDGTTLPEILASLQAEPTEIAPLPRIRVAQDIEALRLRTDAFAEQHDGPPHILLAPLGPPSARSARATFARNVLGVAGLAIDEPITFDSVEAAADAALEQAADGVVLCSSNDAYADLAPSLAAALADRDHDALIGIAGSPDDIDVDQADFYVYQGSSLKETLTTLQECLGMSVKSDP